MPVSNQASRFKQPVPVAIAVAAQGMNGTSFLALFLGLDLRTL
jgi:hypothetical protein